MRKRDDEIGLPFVANLGLLSKAEINSDPWYKSYLNVDYLREHNFGNLEFILCDSGVHPTQATNVSKRIRIIKVDQDKQHDHGGFIASQAQYVDKRFKVVDVIMMNERGTSNEKILLKAINTAVKHSKAKVFNLSLGSDRPMKKVSKRIKQLEKLGYIFISAAGNDGRDVDFPAQDSISVGAVGLDDKGVVRVLDISSKGKVEVASFGGQIRGKVKGGYTEIWDGTSMGAIYVTMLATYVKDLFPECTAQDLVNIIAKTSTDYGCTGKDENYGHGLLDIKAGIEFSKSYFSNSVNGIEEIVAYNEPISISWFKKLFG